MNSCNSVSFFVLEKKEVNFFVFLFFCFLCFFRQKSVYVRVKRKNQTVFLYTDNNEKVSDLISKLAEINEKEAGELRLLKEETVLDNDKTVGDSKIENDNVLFLVYKEGNVLVSVCLSLCFFLFFFLFFFSFSSSSSWCLVFRMTDLYLLIIHISSALLLLLVLYLGDGWEKVDIQKPTAKSEEGPSS